MFLFKKKKLTKKAKLKREKFFQNVNQSNKKFPSLHKQTGSYNYSKQLPNKSKAPFLPKEPKKESFFISAEDKLKINIFTRRLQTNLYNSTFVSSKLKKKFEELYKMVYYYSSNSKVPSWVKYYDLLFISEAHAIIISKYSFNVGPLLTINEIMNANFSLSYLREIFLRFEVIINQMIKLYNEGKNYNYFLKDSVKELKLLGLVSGLLYDKLLLIADVRIKLNKASNIRQIKILDSNNEVERLVDLETEFKFLLSEVYVELISIYVTIQEPYLQKFYYLWKDKALSINKFDTFYYI